MVEGAGVTTAQIFSVVDLAGELIVQVEDPTEAVDVIQQRIDNQVGDKLYGKREEFLVIPGGVPEVSGHALYSLATSAIAISVGDCGRLVVKAIALSDLFSD